MEEYCVMTSCVRPLAIAAFMAQLAITPAGAGGAQADKLAEDIKAIEAQVKADPGAQRLKEWLEHARDYKSGERTDHPGVPPTR